MELIFDESFERSYSIVIGQYSLKTIYHHLMMISSSNIWVFGLRTLQMALQRAGHVAVGEMYLSLYLFPNKHLFYLWPKMTKDEVNYLDRTKHDKGMVLTLR